LNYRLIIILTIILIGIGICFSLIYSPVLDISTFSITGNEFLIKNEIAESIKKYKNRNIILVNTENVKNNLKNNHSQLKNIKITKVYPNKLKINITERTPLAKIKNDNRIIVFDKEGYILEKRKENFNIDVPLIRGFGYSFSNNKLVFTPPLKKIVQQLEDLESALIKDLNLIQYNKLSKNKYKLECLIFDNKTKVKLGELDNLSKKFSILEAAVLEIKKEKLNIDYINLEYPNKPVYKTEN